MIVALGALSGCAATAAGSEPLFAAGLRRQEGRALSAPSGDTTQHAEITNEISFQEAVQAAVLGRRFGDAERLIAAEIERRGEHGSLYSALAEVRVLSVLLVERAASAEIDLAVSTLAQAVSYEPRNPRLWAMRGALALKERRYSDAKKDYGKALALDPESRDLRSDLADLNVVLGDFDSADKHYREQITRGPGDYDAWLKRAIGLRARIGHGPSEGYDERYRAARDALSAAQVIDPSRPETGYHFAVLLLDYPRGGGAWVFAEALLGQFLEKAKQLPSLRAEYENARKLYSNLHAAMDCNFNVTSSERREADAKAKQQEAAREAELENPPAP